MVKVTKRSMLTGIEHTLDIPVDADKLRQYAAGQLSGSIQQVFPELSADSREFIMTGITPDEWDSMVKGPEDE